MNIDELIVWDEEELEPETEEEILELLLRAISNNEGAGWFFVEAVPRQTQMILERVRSQFGKVSVLDLNRQSHSLYSEAIELWEEERFDVLLVRGLEQSVLGYEDAKRALGWETKDLHQYDPRDIPPILSHFNQVRECWRDNLLKPVVFVVPLFVVRYLILRCPDFYDWRVGTFVLPEGDSFYQDRLATWMSDRDFKEYVQLTEEERLKKIQELRDSLDAWNLDDSQKVKLLREQGRLFSINGDNSLALSCYSKANKINPHDANLWFECALKLLSLKRLEEALSSCDKALEYQPDAHCIWCNRGQILASMQKWEDALASCDKAVEYKPDAHCPWFGRGRILANLQRWEDALASYDKALEYKPDAYWIWSQRGGMLATMQKWEDALVSCDKALEYKPDAYWIWSQRGGILGSMRKWEDALASCDTALEGKPDASWIWFQRGGILASMRKWEDALASYDKALEYQPNAYWIWSQRGEILAIMRKWEDALASCDTALEGKPDAYLIWYQRGRILANLQRWEEAFASHSKALKYQPDNYNYTINLKDPRHLWQAIILSWKLRRSLEEYCERHPEILDQQLKIADQVLQSNFPFLYKASKVYKRVSQVLSQFKKYVTRGRSES